MPIKGSNNQTSATPGGDNISVNNPFDEPVVGGVGGTPPPNAPGGSNVASGGATGPPPPTGPPPSHSHPPSIRPPYPPGGPYPPPVSRTPGT